MRFIKMLSIAAVAAIAAMALIGVASASAAVDQETVICKENNALCPEAKQYPSGTVIEALAVNVILLGNVNEKCAHSAMKLKTTAMMAEKLPGEIIGFTFTGCEPCTTLTIEGLAYASSLLMDEASGIWLLKSTKGRIKFTGCPLGVTCTFEVTESGATLNGVNGAEGAEVTAVEIPLKRVAGSEFFCGNSTSLDATYKTKPANTYWFSLFKL